MNSISFEIIDRLPQGLLEVYRKVDDAAKTTGCEYLVIGAIARDMVLHHGFGANIQRGTRDVDFGINVASWGVFAKLKTHLLNNGFSADSRAMQRLHYVASDQLPWEIDIVPFGAIETANSIISWPPDHDIAMSVLGFKEALHDGIHVLIAKDPDLTIPIASPAGLCLLKLIAWLDRPPERRAKDAMDIRYLIDTYPKIPQVFDSLYDDGYMQLQDWDEPRASAMKLGKDVGEIANTETVAFLQNRLMNSTDAKERLAREMNRRGTYDGDNSLTLLEILLLSTMNSIT